jgi:hypothetical protein
MKKILYSCFLFILFLPKTMTAQKTIEGVYSLVGIHDMAAGFRFTPEGQFEFFYIYGVADRNATGSYTLVGDTIKLKSDKEDGKDFPISKQSKKGSGYSIQVTAPNPYLLRNVTALYFIGDKQDVAYSDDKGVIQIDAAHCDKIYLTHEIFPDIACLIKDVDNPNNHFEVALSPTLAQVSFKGIDLVRKGDTLTCLPNYFMPFENIRFVKE